MANGTLTGAEAIRELRQEGRFSSGRRAILRKDEQARMVEEAIQAEQERGDIQVGQPGSFKRESVREDRTPPETQKTRPSPYYLTRGGRSETEKQRVRANAALRSLKPSGDEIREANELVRTGGSSNFADAIRTVADKRRINQETEVGQQKQKGITSAGVTYAVPSTAVVHEGSINSRQRRLDAENIKATDDAAIIVGRARARNITSVQGDLVRTPASPEGRITNIPKGETFSVTNIGLLGVEAGKVEARKQAEAESARTGKSAIARVKVGFDTIVDENVVSSSAVEEPNTVTRGFNKLGQDFLEVGRGYEFFARRSNKPIARKTEGFFDRAGLFAANFGRAQKRQSDAVAAMIAGSLAQGSFSIGSTAQLVEESPALLVAGAIALPTLIGKSITDPLGQTKKGAAAVAAFGALTYTNVKNAFIEEPLVSSGRAIGGVAEAAAEFEAAKRVIGGVSRTAQRVYQNRREAPQTTVQVTRLSPAELQEFGSKSPITLNVKAVAKVGKKTYNVEGLSFPDPYAQTGYKGIQQRVLAAVATPQGKGKSVTLQVKQLGLTKGKETEVISSGISRVEKKVSPNFFDDVLSQAPLGKGEPFRQSQAFTSQKSAVKDLIVTRAEGNTFRLVGGLGQSAKPLQVTREVLKTRQISGGSASRFITQRFEVPVGLPRDSFYPQRAFEFTSGGTVAGEIIGRGSQGPVIKNSVVENIIVTKSPKKAVDLFQFADDIPAFKNVVTKKAALRSAREAARLEKSIAAKSKKAVDLFQFADDIPAFKNVVTKKAALRSARETARTSPASIFTHNIPSKIQSQAIARNKEFTIKLLSESKYKPPVPNEPALPKNAFLRLFGNKRGQARLTFFNRRSSTELVPTVSSFESFGKPSTINDALLGSIAGDIRTGLQAAQISSNPVFKSGLFASTSVFGKSKTNTSSKSRNEFDLSTRQRSNTKLRQNIFQKSGNIFNTGSIAATRSSQTTRSRAETKIRSFQATRQRAASQGKTVIDPDLFVFPPPPSTPKIPLAFGFPDFDFKRKGKKSKSKKARRSYVPTPDFTALAQFQTGKLSKGPFTGLERRFIPKEAFKKARFL